MNNIEYLKIMKDILYGAELVIVNNKYSYICFSRLLPNKEIDIEYANLISIDIRLKLDSFNDDFLEVIYTRNENYLYYLNELKKEYPQIFRKEKIDSIFKN